MSEPNEPVIVFTVRQLFADLRRDFNDRLDAIERKLDDRVSIGTFRALSSELEATRRDVRELQDWQTTKIADETSKRLSDRRLAWAALAVAALSALATLIWLWIGG